MTEKKINDSQDWESIKQTDLIFVSHPITRDLYRLLSQVIDNREGNNKRCIVFLTTFGGDADAAYRIGRCLQHNYEHVRVVVSGFCKSAGTLICMSANELGIGNLGELGPLDVQRLRKDEVGDRSSGLDLTDAIGVISNNVMNSFHNYLLEIKRRTRLSTKIAGDFAVKLATSVIEPLYSQIDPQSLGENQRAITIAYQYGIRLSEKVHSISEDNLLKLITQYPAHGFVIDRGEAKKLFAKVGNITTIENTILGLDCFNFMSEPSEVNPILISSDKLYELMKQKENEAANNDDVQSDSVSDCSNSTEPDRETSESASNGTIKQDKESHRVRRKNR